MLPKALWTSYFRMSNLPPFPWDCDKFPGVSHSIKTSAGSMGGFCSRLVKIQLGKSYKYSLVSGPKKGNAKECSNYRTIALISQASNGEGNGNPLQYSCLENPMDGGAW